MALQAQERVTTRFSNSDMWTGNPHGPVRGLFHSLRELVEEIKAALALEEERLRALESKVGSGKQEIEKLVEDSNARAWSVHHGLNRPAFGSQRIPLWTELKDFNSSLIRKAKAILDDVSDMQLNYDEIKGDLRRLRNEKHICETFLTVESDQLIAEIQSVAGAHQDGVTDEDLRKKATVYALGGAGVGVIACLLLWPLFSWSFGNIAEGGGIVGVSITLALLGGASLYGLSEDHGWAWITGLLFAIGAVVYFAPFLIVGAGAVGGWYLIQREMDSLKNLARTGKNNSKKAVAAIGKRLLAECSASFDEALPGEQSAFESRLDGVVAEASTAMRTLENRQLDLERLSSRAVGDLTTRPHAQAA